MRSVSEALAETEEGNSLLCSINGATRCILKEMEQEHWVACHMSKLGMCVCECQWMCMSMCKHTSVHDHVYAFAGVRWGPNL